MFICPIGLGDDSDRVWGRCHKGLDLRALGFRVAVFSRWFGVGFTKLYRRFGETMLDRNWGLGFRG